MTHVHLFLNYGKSKLYYFKSYFCSSIVLPLIYTSKPCHSFSVACSVLLMLILSFDWFRSIWGGMGQCHIWICRKTLHCSLPDIVCKSREAEKEREPMVIQLTMAVTFVSAPCYHVKHFFFLSEKASEIKSAHYRECLYGFCCDKLCDKPFVCTSLNYSISYCRSYATSPVWYFLRKSSQS